MASIWQPATPATTAAPKMKNGHDTPSRRIGPSSPGFTATKMHPVMRHRQVVSSPTVVIAIGSRMNRPVMPRTPEARRPAAAIRPSPSVMMPKYANDVPGFFGDGMSSSPARNSIDRS